MKIQNSYIKSYLTLNVDSQDIFFTSDLHLGHFNVIKYDNRPFNSVEEMNETIVNNWNSKISKKSIVFFLGDLSFLSSNETKKIFDRLNGVVHVINGNHDRFNVVSKLNIASIQNMLEINVLDEDVANTKNRQTITLCHYPLLVWNKSHHSSWHLHGHCHQSLVNTEQGIEYYKRKVIDVGVNGHGYMPLSYQEIKKIMMQKK